MNAIQRFFPYKSLSVYAVILAYSLVLYTNISYKRWTFREVIEWDVTSYYGYLPAAFIHKDITLKFVAKDPVGYGSRMEFWPETAENGGKVIKTTMGLSILYAPFFALGHWIACTQGYATTGYSAPYQVCIHFASLFYLAIALLYLRKLLLKFFSETASSLTILAIVIGTNLFYYATIESAMSHCFNFSLVTIFLYYSFQWLERQSLLYTIMVGLIGGLIVLVRPVNILVFMVPVLVNITSFKDVKDRALFFLTQWKNVLLMAALIFLVVLPQLVYWKYITGHFFFNSYVGERFYFNNPHVLEGLFSYRKGWLLYTPIMIFSFIGLYSAYKIRKNLFWASFIFMTICIYVVFSWWCWWYGAGFSIRAMVDFCPVFALPMAAFFQQCFDNKSLLFKYILIQVVVILIWFNTFKADQYLGYRIHYDAMTKDSYWMHFLKTGECVDWPAFESTLRNPDYDKARRGEDEYKFSPF